MQSYMLRKLLGSKQAKKVCASLQFNRLIRHRYRATFQWSHYLPALDGTPRLPASTEACASVTSAFLQVIGVLFEVEKLREDQPRNILRLLATNTRRTKVVELSSGTHRVPEELKRHSIGDGEGGHYSTNLDRNRYGSDDQYLATVVRYNLDFLELCPLLVDITILDAKGGNITTCVSADPAACKCSPTAYRGPLSADTRHQRLIRTSGPVADPGGSWGEGTRDAWPVRREGSREASTPRSAPPLKTRAAVGDRGDGVGDTSEDSPSVRVKEEGPPPMQKGGAGNEALFDALLMVAREPQARAPSQVRRKSTARRQSTAKSSDSNEDSVAVEGASPKAGLRRSSRRSKKLFSAAAVENGDPEYSEEESSLSMDESENRRGRSRGGAREVSREWEGAGVPRARRGERNDGLQKLSWSNHTEPRQKAPHRMDQRQHQLQRMKQQYQGASREVQEAEEREGTSEGLIRRLRRTIADQQAASRQQEDQIANLQAELAAAKSVPNGTANGLADSYSAAMLREAQATINLLQHEKTAICAALARAGVPMPPNQGRTEIGPPKQPFGEWQGDHKQTTSAFSSRFGVHSQSFSLAPSSMYGPHQGAGQQMSLPMANGRPVPQGQPPAPSQPVITPPPQMPATYAMPNGATGKPSSDEAPMRPDGFDGKPSNGETPARTDGAFVKPISIMAPGAPPGRAPPLLMPLQDISAQANAQPVAATPGGTKRKREEEEVRVVEAVGNEPEIKSLEGASNPNMLPIRLERDTIVGQGG